MTTFVEAVLAELKESSAVVALLGDRMYPVKAPQSVVESGQPFATLTVISDVPVSTFDGAPADLLRQARVQIDSYASRYKVAHQVADAIDVVVAGLSSPDLSAIRENSQDLYDDEEELYRVTADYFVSM